MRSRNYEDPYYVLVRFLFAFTFLKLRLPDYRPSSRTEMSRLRKRSGNNCTASFGADTSHGKFRAKQCPENCTYKWDLIRVNILNKRSNTGGRHGVSSISSLE
jgi:hypothetical protein